VDEARGTVAALEREVFDEGLLQNRELAVLGVSLYRADRFAVEARRRDDAGRAGVARALGIVADHRTAEALGDAATELGAGHPEIFAQEVVHRKVVAHLPRAVGATVDGNRETCHLSASLSMAWVTGKDRKR